MNLVPIHWVWVNECLFRYYIQRWHLIFTLCANQNGNRRQNFQPLAFRVELVNIAANTKMEVKPIIPRNDWSYSRETWRLDIVLLTFAIAMPVRQSRLFLLYQKAMEREIDSIYSRTRIINRHSGNGFGRTKICVKWGVSNILKWGLTWLFWSVNIWRRYSNWSQSYGNRLWKITRLSWFLKRFQVK